MTALAFFSPGWPPWGSMARLEARSVFLGRARIEFATRLGDSRHTTHMRHHFLRLARGRGEGMGKTGPDTLDLSLTEVV